MVTVTCLMPEHFALIGHREVTCQSTEWITADNILPECRRVGKYVFRYEARTVHFVYHL